MMNPVENERQEIKNHLVSTYDILHTYIYIKILNKIKTFNSQAEYKKKTFRSPTQSWLNIFVLIQRL